MALVLVIDDEKSIRKLLRSGLELMGHEILEACDGSEGVQLVAERRPQLVIMDLVMPGMGGLEALPEMKKLHPSLRGVLISGRIVTHSDAFEAVIRQSGADLFVRKPINLEQFVKQIEDLLSSGPAPGASA